MFQLPPYLTIMKTMLMNGSDDRKSLQLKLLGVKVSVALNSSLPVYIFILFFFVILYPIISIFSRVQVKVRCLSSAVAAPFPVFIFLCIFLFIYFSSYISLYIFLYIFRVRVKAVAAAAPSLESGSPVSSSSPSPPYSSQPAFSD